MHREIWLRSNWRAGLALGIFPALVLIVAVIMLARSQATALVWAGWLLAIVSAGLLLLIVMSSRRPRLAYGAGQLLVYLSGRSPIGVPVEVVECFFLGQGPSILPRLPLILPRRDVEAATLIVRLAESAADWKHRDVDPPLGLWCDGYITIRGAYCEPLSGDLVSRLNGRLVEAHRELKRARAQTAEGIG
jgi:hypothetical protein